MRFSFVAAFLAVLLFSPGFLSAATVSGTVVVTDQASNTRSARSFSETVLWLEPVGAKPLLEPHRSTMLQKNKTFVPHILVVGVGDTVDFPNLDPIFHNAFSSFDGQIFDIGLYPPGKNRSIRFRRPGIVRVFCNIHATMSAVILVLDTPYRAVTNPSGAYQFTGVPAGSYRLHVYQDRSTPEALAALTRAITVPGGASEIPPIAVAENSSLVLPHQNKYGKDYPSDNNAPDYGIPQ